MVSILRLGADKPRCIITPPALLALFSLQLFNSNADHLRASGGVYTLFSAPRDLLTFLNSGAISPHPRIIGRHHSLALSIDVLGFGAALFRLSLPMAEWLSVSRRATGLLSTEVFLYSANWYDLLSTFIGPCLGDIRLQASQFRDLVSYSNLPVFVSCAYVGQSGLVLSLWGIEDRRWRLRIPVLSNAHSESDCLPRRQHTFDTICGEAFSRNWIFQVPGSNFCSCRSPA